MSGISPVTNLHETAATSNSITLAWTAVAPPAESAEGTTVNSPSDPPIIDKDGDAWSLTAKGQITINGVVDKRTGSSDVILLYYHSHEIYQQNVKGTWYYNAGGTNSPWVQTSGPITTHLTVIAELTTLRVMVSSNSNAVTLINQIIIDVGALTP